MRPLVLQMGVTLDGYVSGPGEQPHSQLALQLLDLLGQRRLGHKQLLRCAGEISFGGDGGEVAQQPGVDIHADRL